MSLFEDKKYEEMDWLTKAIEPIVSSKNETLASLPNEFTLTNDQLQYLMLNSWGLSIEVQNAFKFLMTKNNIKIEDPNLAKEMSDCYNLIQDGDLIFYGGDQPRIEGNGVIKLVKIKQMFDEKELQDELGQTGLSKFYDIRNRDIPVERLNEIIELIDGSSPLLSSRSVDKKIRGIIEMIKEIMKENKWNIRNTDLADKVSVWICLYLDKGNLAAMANFCKFKVMTHDGSPIYSIQEEEV